VADRQTCRYWLFLERVAGRELYQVGEFAIWQEVARWLASLHSHFTATAAHLPGKAPLLRHHGDFYRLWLDRAVRFLRDAPLSSEERRGLDGLAARYDQVIDRLTALPSTFLHGEFYASNVLVQDTAAGRRVCPIDWEMAAVGPGLMDLAALTAGRWTDEQRRALALAYWSALPEGGCPEALLSSLAFCRLQVAVQWLGWSADWSPPREHSHDWLGEALSLADGLLDR
jgi:aminoglycoside phosphotransferase (APT) family kinase protein